MEKTRTRGTLFWAASMIILATTILVAAVFLRLWRLPFIQIEVLGIRNSPVHWVGWIGTTYIALYTAFYSLAKRRYPSLMRRLLNFHVLGNLLSVAFISIHFSHQVTRPPTAYPALGTGVVLYASMILLVLTGFSTRFGYSGSYPKQVRWLHAATALTFYLSIAMHIIHGI